jgi:competence protein ComEA
MPRHPRRWWAAGIAGGALVLGLIVWAPRASVPEDRASPPATAQAPAQASPKGLLHASKPARRPIHLNTATTRQLRQLPGVGELLALRIIAARPFKRVEDLAAVKGMTPELYQQLVPLVVL